MTFKDLVTNQRIDIKALSAKYNIPMRTVYRWLDGTRRPPMYLLLMIYDINLLERKVSGHGITFEEGKELAGRMGESGSRIQEAGQAS